MLNGDLEFSFIFSGYKTAMYFDAQRIPPNIDRERLTIYYLI